GQPGASGRGSTGNEEQLSVVCWDSSIFRVPTQLFASLPVLPVPIATSLKSSITCATTGCPYLPVPARTEKPVCPYRHSSTSVVACRCRSHFLPPCVLGTGKTYFGTGTVRAKSALPVPAPAPHLFLIPTLPHVRFGLSCKPDAPVAPDPLASFFVGRVLVLDGRVCRPKVPSEREGFAGPLAVLLTPQLPCLEQG